MENDNGHREYGNVCLCIYVYEANNSDVRCAHVKCEMMMGDRLCWWCLQYWNSKCEPNKCTKSKLILTSINFVYVDFRFSIVDGRLLCWYWLHSFRSKRKFIEFSGDLFHFVFDNLISGCLACKPHVFCLLFCALFFHELQ